MEIAAFQDIQHLNMLTLIPATGYHLALHFSLFNADLKILYGEVTVQGVANDTTTQEVTFSETFSITPVVLVTPTSYNRHP